MRQFGFAFGLLLFCYSCETAEELGATCTLLGIDECDENELTGMFFVELESEPSEVVSLAQAISDEFGLDLLHIYDNAAEGFSVRIPRVLVDQVAAIGGVRRVVEDQERQYSPPPEPDEEFDPIERAPRVPDLPDPTPSLSYGETEVPEGVLRIGGPYVGGLNLED